jgi:hypothetical protein
MPIDFPNSPTVNQQFTAGDTTWYWTGAVWRLLISEGVQGDLGPTGPTGPLGPTGPTGEIVVADIERRVSAYELDILLNLGIYFPKYNTLANLSTVTGTISATSFIL